jgi:hypothetical protein
MEQVMTGKLTEDQWQERATAAAIAAARKIVLGNNAVINMNAPIGRLGDVEWGWIISSILFAWITARAEQAATEELDTEQTIRMTGLDRNPWDAGAIVAILPELAKAKVDWSKPLVDWPKETMVEFLLEALRLVRKGMIARDLGGGITRKSNAGVIARQTNAAAGGPLMTPNELNDPISL